MNGLDWSVLIGTLSAIVFVGWYQEWRSQQRGGGKNAERYLRGGALRWWTVGLSIMATQASAITFLSVPGQAYESGLGFVQFYFGLPLAVVCLSRWVLPIFFGLRVYTAYEYLERRFDRRTRQLVALLFLVSRGLATGIALYAPAIVLSAVLGWSLPSTVITIGVVTILYTVSGGTALVARTQTYQMVVILVGMAFAAVILWQRLPADLTPDKALALAGALGRLAPIDYSLRLDARYTVWSGLLGGLFIQLAYFGTDQSQVQRYLGGSNLAESRLGLLLTGVIKIPMQFLILTVGVLVFLFYQFNPSPVFFDRNHWQTVLTNHLEAEPIAAAHEASMQRKTESVLAFLQADTPASRAQLVAADEAVTKTRREASQLVQKLDGGRAEKDADFIFIDFVLQHFPHGLMGLLIAVIVSAAMSAVASALTSLGTTSVVDFYLLRLKEKPRDQQTIRIGRWLTIFWGVVAVSFALMAAQLDNLIQAVNILGSIFYGPMLGIFALGFFFPRVKAPAAFCATVAAQAVVIFVFATSSVSFLWYNVIGSLTLIALAHAAQWLVFSRKEGKP